MSCLSCVKPENNASQALFLIPKHLSHFLYLRKACHQIDFQGHIHIFLPKLFLPNMEGFFPRFHSTCRWPGCYEGCWFVATCATPAVCPVSPEMVLILRQCWPDLHPCVVMPEKQVRDVPQLSSSISPHREPWVQASPGKRDKGNGTQP